MFNYRSEGRSFKDKRGDGGLSAAFGFFYRCVVEMPEDDVGLFMKAALTRYAQARGVDLPDALKPGTSKWVTYEEARKILDLDQSEMERLTASPRWRSVRRAQRAAVDATAFEREGVLAAAGAIGEVVSLKIFARLFGVNDRQARALVTAGLPPRQDGVAVGRHRAVAVLSRRAPVGSLSIMLGRTQPVTRPPGEGRRGVGGDRGRQRLVG